MRGWVAGQPTYASIRPSTRPTPHSAFCYRVAPPAELSRHNLPSPPHLTLSQLLPYPHPMPHLASPAALQGGAAYSAELRAALVKMLPARYWALWSAEFSCYLARWVGAVGLR